VTRNSTYTIGKLAQAAGVHVETIRYYQRIGLLPQPARQQRTVRRYGGDVLQQLRFIRSAQQLGLSLRDIASLLWMQTAKGCNTMVRDAGTAKSCEETRTMLAQRLAAVKDQIGDLQRVHAALNAVLSLCRKQDSASQCSVFGRLVACEGLCIRSE